MNNKSTVCTFSHTKTFATNTKGTVTSAVEQISPKELAKKLLNNIFIIFISLSLRNPVLMPFVVSLYLVAWWIPKTETPNGTL